MRVTSCSAMTHELVVMPRRARIASVCSRGLAIARAEQRECEQDRVMARKFVGSGAVVARLLLGILAVVFLPLGVVFVIVGLTVDEIRSGEPETFVYVGVPLLAVGLAFALTFTVLQRREHERRRRRRAGLQTTAEVLRADLNHNIRSGAKVGLRLTVRFASAGTPDGTVSRTLLAVPSSAPRAGDRIEIRYDPADPANFEPA
jgi:hypothetical protein